jgi:hypothetical protein
VPLALSSSSSSGNTAGRFRLRAWNDEASDASNVFGIAGGAASGFDRMDVPKLPRPPGPWVRVDFPHPDWGARADSYQQDLRSPSSEGDTWEVEVQSGEPGEPLTLAISKADAASPSLALRLIDREQDTSMDGSLSTAGDVLRYRILPFRDRPYRLAVVVGTDSYVARSSEQVLIPPDRLSMDPVAPNPSRGAARIRFGLPRAARGTLEVFDVLGQRVAKPLDEVLLAPGYHTLVWDANGSGSGRLSSGIYLVRLVVGGETVTRRLALVK